jgi:autotransporter-like protein
VTDSRTLQTQVQPVAATIRSQVFSHLRPGTARARAQLGGGLMLAASDRTDTRSDVGILAAAPGDSSAGTGGGGDSASAWISTATGSLENTFSRTAFYGATHNLLTGFDLTRSDRYVLGISAGHEASNYTTRFNSGDQRVRGYGVNPYFAYLLSDTWSWDLILGYGWFDTRQSRALGSVIGPIAVESDFSSKRSFASTNLTKVSTWGNLKLTGSLGYLGSKRESDAYTESDGTAVDSAKQISRQWNLLGEAAYGSGSTEGFFGATYERVRNPQIIQFTSGEQPANDPSSVMLTAGVRYFGRGMSANFVFNRRVGLEQVSEYGFAMMLRFDL